MATPVSVLIPAYNGARFLPETLESILGQTYPPAEVIVLDDGSQDDTREAGARFGDRVRYHFVANGGICRARNMAASLATSPYLAFCDQDDLWLPDKLAQQMELHERDEALNFSFTNFCYMADGVRQERTKLDDAPTDFFADAPPPPGTSSFVYPGSLYGPLLRFQPIWPSTVVVRSDFFRAVGGFREEFGKNPSEDFEFSLRCLLQEPVGVVREPVVSVRRHAGNYSGSNDGNTRGQIEILQYVLEHHPISSALKAQVTDQIELRRVEAAYGAFRSGDFALVRSLLSPVPRNYLDRKSTLKLWIARLPQPLAKPLWRLLAKQ